MSTIITNPNNTHNPIKCIIFSTFRFIGLPLIHSIRVNKTCEPSRAGKGKMLKTARLAEIRGIKINKFSQLACVAPAIEVIAVTGPPTELIGS